jgi:hypothetical protein
MYGQHVDSKHSQIKFSMLMRFVLTVQTKLVPPFAYLVL